MAACGVADPAADPVRRVAAQGHRLWRRSLERGPRGTLSTRAPLRPALGMLVSRGAGLAAGLMPGPAPLVRVAPDSKGSPSAETGEPPAPLTKAPESCAASWLIHGEVSACPACSAATLQPPESTSSGRLGVGRSSKREPAFMRASAPRGIETSRRKSRAGG